MLMITSVALVVVAAMVLWHAPLNLPERLGARNFTAGAVLAAWVAAAAASAIGTLDNDRANATRTTDVGELASAMRSIGDIDWERGGASHPRPPNGAGPGVASRATTEVAPVDSLIGGLEARLAAGPADAKGWALLAQSYAFVGLTDKAEAALNRAVELGFDEAALRTRVDAARRETRSSVDWIEQTLRR